jgi:hypothetical protein
VKRVILDPRDHRENQDLKDQKEMLAEVLVKQLLMAEKFLMIM